MVRPGFRNLDRIRSPHEEDSRLGALRFPPKKPFRPATFKGSVPGNLAISSLPGPVPHCCGEISVSLRRISRAPTTSILPRCHIEASEAPTPIFQRQEKRSSPPRESPPRRGWGGLSDLIQQKKERGIHQALRPRARIRLWRLWTLRLLGANPLN